ncbi:MAG: hypothetical protein ACI8Q1_003610 [Parvicella sp.]|jgi:hypothetical protein
MFDDYNSRLIGIALLVHVIQMMSTSIFGIHVSITYSLGMVILGAGTVYKLFKNDAVKDSSDAS